MSQTYDALLKRFLTNGGIGGSARERVLQCVCENAPISLNKIVLKTGISKGNCSTVLSTFADAGILAQTRNYQWVPILAPTEHVLAVATCGEEATTIRPSVELVSAMRTWLARKGLDLQHAYLECEVVKRPELKSQAGPDIEALALNVVAAFDSGVNLSVSIAKLRQALGVAE